MKISKEVLQEWFRYEEGNLYRLKTTQSRPDTLGKRFGGLTGTGYIQGWFRGSLYYLHDLIWVYHFGAKTEGFILDHIDGDKLNNRVENLREATVQQNVFNSKSREGSTSPHKGVSWDSSRGKWKAAVVVGGNYKMLGRFDSEEGAARACETVYKEKHGDYFRETN